MEDRYTLLFAKGSGSTVSSYTQWGIVCCNVPFKAGVKVKDLAKRDWPDEHGDDVFIPAKTMFEAYDVEFEMAYAGQELASNPFNLSLAVTNINAFKKWLTGNNVPGGSGAELKIYSPFASIGRQKCHLLEISDEDPCLMTKQQNGNVYNENVVTFKVKFRVNDPITDITLTESSSSSHV